MRGDSGGKLGPGAQLGCFSRIIRVKERVGRCVPEQIRAREQLGRGSFPGQTLPLVAEPLLLLASPWGRFPRGRSCGRCRFPRGRRWQRVVASGRGCWAGVEGPGAKGGGKGPGTKRRV